MLWCSTLSGYPTHTKLRLGEIQLSSLCSGIKVSSFSLSGKPSLFLHANQLTGHPVVRYASDLTPDQKDALLDVVRATPHPQISAEIRRELVNSVVRGAPRLEPGQDVDML